MSNQKEYKIKNFDDLCDLVNPENFEALSNDLRNWLVFYHLMIQSLREKFPKETEGKTNTEISKANFTWVDDGKNDIIGMDIQSGNNRVRFDF